MGQASAAPSSGAGPRPGTAAPAPPARPRPPASPSARCQPLLTPPPLPLAVPRGSHSHQNKIFSGGWGAVRQTCRKVLPHIDHTWPPGFPCVTERHRSGCQRKTSIEREATLSHLRPCPPAPRPPSARPGAAPQERVRHPPSPLPALQEAPGQHGARASVHRCFLSTCDVGTHRQSGHRFVLGHLCPRSVHPRANRH